MNFYLCVGEIPSLPPSLQSLQKLTPHVVSISAVRYATTSNTIVAQYFVVVALFLFLFLFEDWESNVQRFFLRLRGESSADATAEYG